MIKNRKKALLVSFLVSLVMLAVVVVITLLADKYLPAISFDTVGLIIGDVIGFLLIFRLVYGFLVKQDKEDSGEQNHNIY